MSESSDQIEQTEVAIDVLSMEAVGRLLVEARERMGLSVDEVAARLRLMPRQVLALESGDISALPGPAFVRGFLRNYAKLLQIDAEPMLAACSAHGANTATQKQISLHSENIQISGHQRKGWTVYLSVIVLFMIVLGGWFVYTDYTQNGRLLQPASEPAPQAQPIPGTSEIPQPLPLEPAQPGQPAAPSGQTSEALTPAPLPQAPAAAVPAQPAPLEAGAPALSAAKLALTTSKSTWVSVRDRDGKEILSKTVAAGGSEIVQGTPPLKIIIGNATGIELSYNDKPVDLTPHIRGNVARFTLE